MNKLILTFLERKNELLSGIIEHIQISFIALIIALIIAIPLGIYLSYHKKLANIVIAINVITTIKTTGFNKDIAFFIPIGFSFVLYIFKNIKYIINPPKNGDIALNIASLVV